MRKINKNKKNIITQKKIHKGGLFITKSKINSLNKYFLDNDKDTNFLEWYKEREKTRTKYNYFTKRNIDGYRKLYESDLKKLEILKLAINYYEELFSKNNISQEDLKEISMFFRKDFYEQPIIIKTKPYLPTVNLNNKINKILISQLKMLYNEKVINKDTFETLNKKINKINNLVHNNTLYGNSISSSRNTFNSSSSTSRNSNSNDTLRNITDERVESLLFGRSNSL